MTATVSASAAVRAAGVAALPMFTVVMVTVRIRIENKRSRKIGFDSLVCTARNAGKKLDSGFGKCVLRSAADSSANQNINPVKRKKRSQCAVTASHCRNDVFGGYGAILNLIKFKLFRVAEMGKHVTVFVSDCNFHKGYSFYIGYVDYSTVLFFVNRIA